MTVNNKVRENGEQAYDWVLHKLTTELYWWYDAFNILYFNEELPTPVISFEKTKVTNLGHYVYTRNASGLKYNININCKHLYRPLVEILSTLLHEMTHEWEELQGRMKKSWAHTRAFRDKTASMGIPSNKKGQTVNYGDPFLYHCRRYGVEFKLNIEGVKPVADDKPKGKSKLVKWVCDCGQNVRVGKKEFHARCTLCDSEFVRVEE